MTDLRSTVSSWTPTVQQIRAGSEAAVEELYDSLRSIRYFLRRRMGPDQVEDAYHALMIELVGAIRKGQPREPETLPAYAMTIARRKVIQYIESANRERQVLDVDNIILPGDASESPEQLVLRSERQAIARRVLVALRPREREALMRFYLNDEPREQIQAAMGLSYTQFRLLKSRAKARYTDLVRESMKQSRPKPNTRAGCRTVT
jgi:RNA polymerase sigma-70 factor (ECF subfamily)